MPALIMLPAAQPAPPAKPSAAPTKVAENPVRSARD
jgi:hypothetical protein